jgi:trehalose-phosphatase
MRTPGCNRYTWPVSVNPSCSTVDDLVSAITDDRGRALLLLTDFDGTLCEFQTDPAAVFLSDPCRTALSTLATRPRLSVGVVSGRRAADVRRRTMLDGPVYYAGLHGMEIDGPDTRFEVPHLAARRDVLEELARSLTAAISPLPGAFLENKELSWALHTRAASAVDRQQAERAFWSLATPALEGGTLRLQRGDCVFELLPDISWNKGDAVRWIEADATRRLGAAVRPIYLGDDLTDEHAFVAVGTRGITVVVGRRPSQAGRRLKDPAAVEQLLIRLVAATKAS